MQERRALARDVGLDEGELRMPRRDRESSRGNPDHRTREREMRHGRVGESEQHRSRGEKEAAVQEREPHPQAAPPPTVGRIPGPGGGRTSPEGSVERPTGR